MHWKRKWQHGYGYGYRPKKDSPDSKDTAGSKDTSDAKGTSDVEGNADAKGNAEGTEPVQKGDGAKRSKHKLIHEELADEE